MNGAQDIVRLPGRMPGWRCGRPPFLRSPFHAKVFRYIRQNAHLGVRRLEARLGLPRGQIANWLRTDRPSFPRLDILQRFAKATGINIAYWADDSIAIEEVTPEQLKVPPRKGRKKPASKRARRAKKHGA